MKFGIIVFPGTWSDQDCYYALHDILGQEADYIWHKETKLSGYDCLILPGGFSYGDYLRAGAIARFSPVMAAVEQFADKGGLVIGICNGFQILCEAGLLPGVLLPNSSLQYRCQWVNLRVENSNLPFTSKCCQEQVLKIPISHYEGNYYTDEATLQGLEINGQIVFCYSTSSGKITNEANPNGSLRNIAGIINKKGNILGMMPHPERACESLLGSTDGNIIWESIIEHYQGSSG
ncbi:MAG: phosphoribosylformylglycinamidine synthase I [Chloroflexi bacterium CG_4_9_14_3_um_filter_45_9]|nr:MAG: phosphoribosylformylglycinamidine synthase I [Dehalococcoidia bacterium CG2_30_46_9]PIU23570.1 MAG: phosphoribosylformylglycinamidine synthase I [Chloroflexi bacterium CG08_land_8_20_14_0_20_45_12]PIX27319.1 MAG: phosphoribosylformylglycinamidine synthase I [Chloroflexi bacterium CG_4_8_14_3_um_filter_45_15]PJB48360.1 MAG: phosphoribosylformylglycinamidine synthase I [Chloroflexi bacterium CG_4_9_14_3_um_filter_45_9]